MEAEGGVFDIFGGPAVMVDDGHPAAGLQNLGTLHQARPVGVHHDQQRPGTHLHKGLRRIHEHALILRQAAQHSKHGLGGVFLQVDDNLGPPAELPGGAAHAHGGAHRVHVSKAVAHDVDVRGVRQQFPQGVGHDPGFHLGALFRGLGPSAVKGKICSAPNHRLVAPPAQGHLQGKGGIFIQRRDAVRLPAQADGESGVAPLPHLDVPHGVQDRKLLLHKMAVISLLKQEEVMVPLCFDKQPVSHSGPAAELFINLGQHGAALRVGTGVHQVLVVVHHQNAHHQAGGIEILPKAVHLCGVHPVGGGYQVLLSAAALGPDQAAVNPEAAVVHADPLRALLPSLQQPLDGELRGGVLHLYLKKMLPDPRQLEEVLIAPDHLPGVGAEDHNGQGGVDEGGLAGGVHVSGDIVNILKNALAAFFIAAHEVRVQSHSGHALRQGQRRADGDGGQGKGQEAEKIELQVWFQQTREFLVVHGGAP